MLMPYEYKKTDVYDFADTINIEKHEKGNELFFKYCPYCHGGGHDKDTFSINLDNGTFKCFRASCGKQGHFVELARDFHFKLDFGEIKEYKQLPQKPITIRPRAVEYLAGRGISEDITRKYNITTRTDYPDVLVFPFHDENNVRQFIKYRNTRFNGHGNKEWCEKDTKPILFGMAQCEDFTTLAITEGQIDSLSLAECGIKNAVSVPTGALGFTWFRHCEEWINKFESIIVFGDYEKGKISLVDELQARVKQLVKVVQKVDYLGEKDANAILQKYGRQAVITAIENAKPVEIKSIKDLSDVKSIDIHSLPKIKTNIRELDRIIGGLYFGQVILLTGKRGEGKSTFMSQLVVEALDQNVNTFVYSGELADYHFKRWLDLQVAGPNNIKITKNEYGDENASIEEQVQEQINAWYRGRAYIYDNNYIPDKNDEMDSLVATVEKSIIQYDVKLICIDNLMTAIEPDETNNIYAQQSKFVGDLKKLAMKYNVVVILVAHPRKTKEAITNDDVSGSADITNKVDVVISYGRALKEDLFDGKITVTKNRLIGTLALYEDAVKVYYDSRTKRIKSITNDPNRIYNWQTKWLEVSDDDQDMPF